MRVGIDVGGTNTDAVVLSGKTLLAAHKEPTTKDIKSGVLNAMRNVLARIPNVERRVNGIVIGTTQFANAFIERKKLTPVAIMRLALPSTTAVPPLIDWPAELTDVIGIHRYILPGGYEYDGRELSSYSETAVRAAISDIQAKGIKAVAVSSVFAPLNNAMERKISEALRDRIPDVHVTLSSDIGRLGLLGRENAAIMNASLCKLADIVIGSFEEALESLKLDVPFYISQNDGTLLQADVVRRYPILTFSSGQTNSIRGAAFLSRQENAIVVDIGGTTSDVGALSDGYPRESSMTMNIGGVRTNFRMPDVCAAGLGGGSYVRERKDGSVDIGPDSVGFELANSSYVFGGDVLTATDIAVAAGRVSIGDPGLVQNLDRGMVERADQTMHDIIVDTIDRMKTSDAPTPVILVGGGSGLISPDLPGVSEVIVPEHASVANAIGAAIAQVGGESDHIYSYVKQSRCEIIEVAKNRAVEAAIKNGSEPGSTKVIDVDELPLAYLSGDAVRIRVKAVGDLPETPIPVEFA